jgi:hypothetical protein
MTWRASKPNVGLPSNATAVFKGEGGLGDLLYQTVSGAGDLNGDGWGDIVIGTQYRNGAIGTENVYVFLGGCDGTDCGVETALFAAFYCRTGSSPWPGIVFVLHTALMADGFYGFPFFAGLR